MNNTNINPDLCDICSGCGVCTIICTKKAISVKPDSRGFYMPVVDIQQCLN